MPKSHITKREAQAVCNFALDVIGMLHLPGWQVLVMEEPCHDDALASIDRTYGKYTAEIRLCADWMTRSHDERRETITHEVLHLLHFRIDHIFGDARRAAPKHQRKVLARRYRHETELMVDHLAKFLSRTHTLSEAWDHAHQRKP